MCALDAQNNWINAAAPVRVCCCATIVCPQELHTLRRTDHQAAELLQHTINGIAYASPRSLAITLQHFCRVQDAVAARRHRLDEQQRGSSSSISGTSSAGCLPLPTVTWSVGVTVDGHYGSSPPDLSTLQGTMQVGPGTEGSGQRCTSSALRPLHVTVFAFECETRIGIRQALKEWLTEWAQNWQWAATLGMLTSLYYRSAPGPP
jgi:hypothetical protein